MPETSASEVCEPEVCEPDAAAEPDAELDVEPYSLAFTAVPFFCTQAVISWFRLLLPPIPPPPSWM